MCLCSLMTTGSPSVFGILHVFVVGPRLAGTVVWGQGGMVRMMRRGDWMGFSDMVARCRLVGLGIHRAWQRGSSRLSGLRNLVVFHTPTINPEYSRGLWGVLLTWRGGGNINPKRWL